ncbi:hypothetical protein [Falsihalocynthiibacter sp. CO-5D18]|uniref:hypothetical protein n=1 Tax=Falsihalocynthiibacter sp. CO-5D18 TaxID=3240872 RepID=UPI00350FB331
MIDWQVLLWKTFSINPMEVFMFLADLPRATAQAVLATPEKALSSEERVPAAALRALAQGGPERVCGVISLEDQAALAMYLPDIIGELLAYRAQEAALRT